MRATILHLIERGNVSAHILNLRIPKQDRSTRFRLPKALQSSICKMQMTTHTVFKHTECPDGVP